MFLIIIFFIQHFKTATNEDRICPAIFIKFIIIKTQLHHKIDEAVVFWMATGEIDSELNQ